ncbi:ABC transporter permease [Faecalicatena contorta]|uniref:Monosaccharide ABC transporter membrane protein, CUT2 family n=1 Tax=Faecalicatena contorta TaxID=39482 RepID=A0A315ZWH0_9FIRM|nr:ABC transporter permease [Faecalicatena contorta]PWJ49230.1 monosaccharide ABC transporter membrane protein (CUT2 family) [Faecalicatena contorta]SUQ14935.1 monosaccharide ABC transporter membrane protein, CUT2 family [Faecalicatena contorta]
MKDKVVYQLRDKAIWVVFVILFVAFTIANSTFITPNNLIMIARQVSMYGIASIGMTFVILLGGIDLATGSIITFINILCAYFMVNSGMNMFVAILLSLIVATLIGTINGFMVSSIGMPALIATFATQTIFKGFAYILCGGRPVNGFTTDFKVIGQGWVGPIPVPVIIMILCFIVGSFILNKTYFGRYFYAVGGNEEAAKLSGIRVGRVKYLVYSLSGLFAGLAGIVMLSRTNSGQPTAGDGYEFDVITCVVLGGVSVTGGFGKLSNVAAGVLIIGALTNGMVLMNVNSYIQMVVKGLVLAFAVGFDCLQKKRQTT